MSEKLVNVLQQTFAQFEASDLYYGHGTDNAWDEAVWLVLSALNLPVDSGDEVLDLTLSGAEIQVIHELAASRIGTRKPLAYLLKEAYFAGLKFYVDERVLVPRSPFAELIQQGLEPWLDLTECASALELCTGSGCIAIALATCYLNLQMDASDISEDALAVAGINVSDHQLEERITLFHSDLFKQIPSKQYDLIVANPPYVDAEDLDAMPEEYHHEPEIGLGSGADGLYLTKQILQAASNYLKPNGVLVVEVGNSQEALVEQFPNAPFVWLTLESGGHGIFLIERSGLERFLF